MSKRSNTMFQRILVPLDGSLRAEQAIPVAARMVRASGGTIVFVRVVLPPVEFGTYAPERVIASKPSAFEKHLAEAESYLTEVVRAYTEDLAGIKTEIDVDSGAASTAIFSAARLEEIDLIVMCSHGETGLKRWVFVSVAQEAVSHSPVPVLVLNEAGGTFLPSDPTRPLRVLVPLDGSPLSEAALEPTIQLLGVFPSQAPATVHLLRVVDLPPADGKLRSPAHISDGMQQEARREAETYLKAVADRLCERSLPELTLTVTTSVEISRNVAGTISKLAEQGTSAEQMGGYDLIVMATHGRSGLRRLVMGSVTEHLLGATKLPVLIVRPPKGRPEPEKMVEVTELEVETEQSWVGLL
jgi:nucleotide-binding universal stress UspA family protein